VAERVGVTFFGLVALDTPDAFVDQRPQEHESEDRDDELLELQ